MERNKDKVKRLAYELGCYQKKVADQKKELDRAEKLNALSRQVILDTHETANALQVQMVLSFGKERENENGVYELVLPSYDSKSLAKEYEVAAKWDEENGVYRILVKRIVDEEEKRNGDATCRREINNAAD